MKRKLAFTLLFLTLTAICYLGYSIYSDLQEKQTVEERISSLPNFKTTDLDRNIIDTKDVEDSSLVLTYFNTGCEFCQAEIRSMKEHKLLHQRAFIWLISDEPKNILKEFATAFELDSLQNIQVLWDKDAEVKELFGVKGVPNTFVYGKDGSLLKSFQGETRAEVIYQLIK